MKELFANVSVTVDASTADVWQALTDPALIEEYCFGTNVDTDWRPGSPILFRGSWEGKSYEDKGVILEAETEKLLSYTYWSSMSGMPDVPEKYKTVTFELAQEGTQTLLKLHQSNSDEKSQAHSTKNWQMVLEGLKKVAQRL